MIIKSLMTLICILSIESLYAQKYSNVDITAIEKSISDPSSQFFYDSLLTRYYSNDSLLTVEDYQHLYYGWVFQCQYRPLLMGIPYKDFYKLAEASKHDSVIMRGNEILKEAPFHLDILFALSYSYDAIGNLAMKQAIDSKITNIKQVILSSGDGKSEKTAYVVIEARDEFATVGFLLLHSTGSSIDGPPLMRMDQKFETIRIQTPNELKIKKLVFNIQLLSNLSRFNKNCK